MINTTQCPKCKKNPTFISYSNAWTKKFVCIECGEYEFFIAYPDRKKKFHALKVGVFKPAPPKKWKNNKECCFCKNEKKIHFVQPEIWYYGRQLKLCEDCYKFYTEQKVVENSFQCQDCGHHFILQREKEWAKVCYPCWKKSMVDPHKKHLIQTVASRIRKKHFKNDTPELQEKRKDFVKRLIVTNPGLLTLEMYPCQDSPEGVLKSNEEIPQYFNEYKYHNTRKKLKTETIFESDRIENIDKAMDFICSVSLILVNKKQVHSIFYAVGQRCPHIRIYDVKELEDLTPIQREKSQEEFWRMVVPFFIHLADKGVWQDEHYLPLENSIHYKYGTPYKEIFKYKPEVITQ